MTDRAIDFADAAAGLSLALKRIADGFVSLGDDHFQDVAKSALERWGYFPPNPPPDPIAQREKVREGFVDALNQVMAMLSGFNADVAKDRDHYLARATAAEQKVQDLLRVVEALDVKDETETPA